MNDTVVFYNGEQVSAPKEVAEFQEQDRKRAQAKAKQDKRHLSRSEFETVPSSHGSRASGGVFCYPYSPA